VVLEKLGLDRKPMVLVFNKIDKVDGETVARALRRYGEAVAVSAIDRSTLLPLIEVLQNKVQNVFVPETETEDETGGSFGGVLRRGKGG